MKSVRIRNYSGAHFPAFGLNTDRYSVFLRIQLECGPYSVQMRENAYQNNSEYGYLLRSLLEMVLVLYEYFLLQQSYCLSVYLSISLSLSISLYLSFSLVLCHLEFQSIEGEPIKVGRLEKLKLKRLPKSKGWPKYIFLKGNLNLGAT